MKRHLILILAMIALTVGRTGEAWSQKKVRIEAKLSKDSTLFTLSLNKKAAKPGQIIEAKVHLDLAPTWHIYSSKNSEDVGVSSLELALPSELDSIFELVSFEEKGELHMKYDSNFEAEVSSYETDFDVIARLRVKPGAQHAKVPVSLLVTYGACSGALCLPPRTFAVPMTFGVSATTAPVCQYLEIAEMQSGEVNHKSAR